MWAWDRSDRRPARVGLERRPTARTAARCIERYIGWAADVDRVHPAAGGGRLRRHTSPTRVLPGHDLADAPTARAVRYRDRIDALVVDDDDDLWLLATTGSAPCSSTPKRLRLDERGGDRVRGPGSRSSPRRPRSAAILYNEITARRRTFRRTAVRRLSRLEVAAPASQLGLRGRSTCSTRPCRRIPTPRPDHCARCRVPRRPALRCTGRRRRRARCSRSPLPRPRPADEPEEGRLGGVDAGASAAALPDRPRRSSAANVAQ